MREISLTDKTKFLGALALGQSVKAACEYAGIPRRTVYYWRSEDTDFYDAWEEAKSGALEILEDELRERAMDRSDPKSHILLIFLLKKLNPEYKENYRPAESKLPTKAQEFDFSPEEVNTALAILNAAKAKAQDD